MSYDLTTLFRGRVAAMKKVTGLGGVFFRCSDPESTREWYKQRLGIDSDRYGFSFLWRDLDQPDQRGYTVWSPFPEETEYFNPSDKQFMINYRVADIDVLVDQLRDEGVEIVGGPEQYKNGKFAWILDPEGNKIELWEPIDSRKDPYLPDDS